MLAIVFFVVFLTTLVVYPIGIWLGRRGERLRATYIFDAARQIVSGGALWIVQERLFAIDRTDSWMRRELHEYMYAKEQRRDHCVAKLTRALEEAEKLLLAEKVRSEDGMSKDPAKKYDSSVYAEAYGWVSGAAKDCLTVLRRER